ncbi:hypothetical protein EDB84DRAFT_1674449 [Lactarius hengduanensis]|nr:hypothetical protein EDB84DRAFT_1674449 [Lactarius hengduanensis]
MPYAVNLAVNVFWVTYCKIRRENLERLQSTVYYHDAVKSPQYTSGGLSGGGGFHAGAGGPRHSSKKSRAARRRGRGHFRNAAAQTRADIIPGLSSKSQNAVLVNDIALVEIETETLCLGASGPGHGTQTYGNSRMVTTYDITYGENIPEFSTFSSESHLKSSAIQSGVKFHDLFLLLGSIDNLQIMCYPAVLSVLSLYHSAPLRYPSYHVRLHPLNQPSLVSDDITMPAPPQCHTSVTAPSRPAAQILVGEMYFLEASIFRGLFLPTCSIHIQHYGSLSQHPFIPSIELQTPPSFATLTVQAPEVSPFFWVPQRGLCKTSPFFGDCDAVRAGPRNLSAQASITAVTCWHGLCKERKAVAITTFQGGITEATRR